MERGNGNTVLLTVIGVATLLVALVGATFAYFTATIQNVNRQSLSVTTANPVGLEYVGGSLTLPNALPGDENDMDFTITNPSTSSVSQAYSLRLVVDSNNFVDTVKATGSEETTHQGGQLVVTVTGDQIDETNHVKTYDFTNSATPLTDAQRVIVENITIAPGVEHEYNLNVAFNNLEGYNQDDNKTKSFHAHVNIYDVHSLSVNTTTTVQG